MTGLMPLLANYPTFPLRGIVSPMEPAPSAALDLLPAFEQVVESLIDPRSLSATQAQGNGVYIAFVTGLLTVSPGLALASFPELQRYPATELSQEVAASVRASMRILTSATDDLQSNWPLEFWRHGMELTPCR